MTLVRTFRSYAYLQECSLHIARQESCAFLCASGETSFNVTYV